MKAYNLKSIGLALFTFFAIACENKSATLAPAPVYFPGAPEQAKGNSIDINSEIDILFVIDDSGSMLNHQQNLSRNIDKFVDGFAKNSIVDFHIGVVSIFDTERYGAYDLLTGKSLRTGVVNEFNRDGKRNFEPLGELRPLVAPVGKEELLGNHPARYVTRADGYVDILKESLKIGVSNYVGKDEVSRWNRAYDKALSRGPKALEKLGPEPEQTGPEFEDLFSPAVFAFSPRLREGVNKGFFREKSQLVVVFVTDANDASNYSPSYMARYLNRIKGNDPKLVNVVGIIIPTDARGADLCARDPSGFPYRIEELISLTHGTTLNLCKDYSKQLQALGQKIRDQSIKEIRHKIEIVPNVDKVTVTYGNKDIPYSSREGWSYDEDDRAIVIRGADKWADDPSAKISVFIEPVNTKLWSAMCYGLGCRPTQPSKK